MKRDTTWNLLGFKPVITWPDYHLRTFFVLWGENLRETFKETPTCKEEPRVDFIPGSLFNVNLGSTKTKSHHRSDHNGSDTNFAQEII